MPFIDDMAERDLAILQALDGREVTFIPDGGASRIISGMLQALSELVPGDSVEVVASAPILSVRTIDLPELDVGDRFQANGFVELVGNGRYPRQQLVIGLGKARARIDQNQRIAVANEVNVVHQAGK